MIENSFDRFKKAYPKRDGANPWKPAEKKFEALVKSGVDPNLIIAGARQFSVEEHARGKIGTQFIPMAVTWLNQQRYADTSPPDDEAAQYVRYHAEDGSPQLAAWDAWSIRTRGKRLPRDRFFGWYVDSEWPPAATPAPENVG
jgi:hypothetical protein